MKEFWKAALIRALRTGGQIVVSMTGCSKLLSDVNWVEVLSCTLMAMILSFMTSIITGLPEVKDND